MLPELSDAPFPSRFVWSYMASNIRGNSCGVFMPNMLLASIGRRPFVATYGRWIESGVTVTSSGKVWDSSYYQHLLQRYEAREMSTTCRGIDGSDSLADKYARTQSGENVRSMIGQYWYCALAEGGRSNLDFCRGRLIVGLIIIGHNCYWRLCLSLYFVCFGHSS
jgi:hypothetical protein